MIRTLFSAVAFALVVLVAGQPQAAADRKAEVQAMMTEALSHYGAVGVAQATTDFADKSGQYFKGDLYVVIHGIDGKMVAHPVVPKLNGRDQLPLKDTDGKEFVKELVAAAQAGGGWVEYKWSNPETKKIAPKIAYAMPTGDGNFLIIGYYQ